MLSNLPKDILVHASEFSPFKFTNAKVSRELNEILSCRDIKDTIDVELTKHELVFHLNNKTLESYLILKKRLNAGYGIKSIPILLNRVIEMEMFKETNKETYIMSTFKTILTVAHRNNFITDHVLERLLQQIQLLFKFQNNEINQTFMPLVLFIINLHPTYHQYIVIDYRKCLENLLTILPNFIEIDNDIPDHYIALLAIFSIITNYGWLKIVKQIKLLRFEYAKKYIEDQDVESLLKICKSRYMVLEITKDIDFNLLPYLYSIYNSVLKSRIDFWFIHGMSEIVKRLNKMEYYEEFYKLLQNMKLGINEESDPSYNHRLHELIDTKLLELCIHL